MITVITISSCNDNKKEDVAAGVCLTLTKAQLDSWFPTYSEPTSLPANQIMYVKFYPVWNANTNSYDVTARGLNQSGNQLGSDLMLNSKADCGTQLQIRSYEYSMVELNLLNSSGDLLNGFEELILNPTTWVTDPAVLQLNVSVKINGATLSRGEILPCPPCVNCRPPCDSTADQDTLLRVIDTMKKGQ
jgi:hypothetical protein